MNFRPAGATCDVRVNWPIVGRGGVEGRPRTGKAAGIQIVDVVLAINGQRLATEDDVRRAVSGIRRGKSSFQIRRRTQTMTIEVDCPTCEEQ